MRRKKKGKARKRGYGMVFLYLDVPAVTSGNEVQGKEDPKKRRRGGKKERGNIGLNCHPESVRLNACHGLKGGRSGRGKLKEKKKKKRGRRQHSFYLAP